MRRRSVLGSQLHRGSGISVIFSLLIALFLLGATGKTSSDPLVYLDAGKKLAARGSWADAEKYFRAALQLDPRLAPAYQELAATLAKLGRQAEADKALETARGLEAPATSPPMAAAQPPAKGSLLLFDERIPFGVLAETRPTGTRPPWKPPPPPWVQRPCAWISTRRMWPP